MVADCVSIQILSRAFGSLFSSLLNTVLHSQCENPMCQNTLSVLVRSRQYVFPCFPIIKDAGRGTGSKRAGTPSGSKLAAIKRAGRIEILVAWDPAACQQQAFVSQTVNSGKGRNCLSGSSKWEICQDKVYY